MCHCWYIANYFFIGERYKARQNKKKNFKKKSLSDCFFGCTFYYISCYLNTTCEKRTVAVTCVYISSDLTNYRLNHFYLAAFFFFLTTNTTQVSISGLMNPNKRQWRKKSDKRVESDAQRKIWLCHWLPRNQYPILSRSTQHVHLCAGLDLKAAGGHKVMDRCVSPPSMAKLCGCLS